MAQVACYSKKRVTFPFLKRGFASQTQRRPNSLHPFLFADLLRITHYWTAFNYMSGTSGKSTRFPEESKVLEHQCSTSTLGVHPKVHLSLLQTLPSTFYVLFIQIALLCSQFSKCCEDSSSPQPDSRYSVQYLHFSLCHTNYILTHF